MKQRALFQFSKVALFAVLLPVAGCAAVDTEDAEEADDSATETTEAYALAGCPISLSALRADGSNVYAKVSYANGNNECGYMLTVDSNGSWIANSSVNRVATGSGTLTVTLSRSALCTSGKRIRTLPGGQYAVRVYAHGQSVPNQRMANQTKAQRIVTMEITCS